MGLPDGLLAEVKNYLDITWEDEIGEKKLAGIIARGMREIDRMPGTQQDYTEESPAKQLLFDYCRYARDNALQDFRTDYRSELLALQVDAEVQYAQNQSANL